MKIVKILKQRHRDYEAIVHAAQKMIVSVIFQGKEQREMRKQIELERR